MIISSDKKEARVEALLGQLARAVSSQQLATAIDVERQLRDLIPAVDPSRLGAIHRQYQQLIGHMNDQRATLLKALAEYSRRDLRCARYAQVQDIY